MSPGALYMNASTLSRYQRMRDQARLWGWGRLLYWVLMTVVSKLGLRVHRVAANPLNPERPPVVLAEGYTTRYVEFDELARYVDSNEGLDDDFISMAGGRGDRCIGNFYHGELVGYAFYATERARVTPQLDVLVPKGFRYGYKGWTHPDHRRKKLNKARAQLNWPNPGIPIWYIETHNFQSLLTTFRYPAERPVRMGYIGWFTIAGREFPFSTRVARRVGLRLVRREHDGRFLYTEV